MKTRGIVTWGAIGLGGALVLAQAIRPDRTNPAIDPTKILAASAHVPADVAAIFDRACKDCHTSETVWPWYTNIAPVSWWISNHVREGQREVNFSRWADLAPQRKAKKLGDICDQVKKGDMPLSSYVLGHRSARLSDEDRQAICAWTTEEKARLGPLPPLPDGAGGRGRGAN